MSAANLPVEGHPDHFNRPCISVDKQHDEDSFTVAEYDALQRQRIDQPLWARVVPPVEKLSREPSYPYDVHITDQPAYDAQMRRLIGLG